VHALAVVLTALALTPLADRSGDGSLIVRPVVPARTIVLHASPAGPVRARVKATIFGSPLVFSVARVRGQWLAVRSEALGNGQLGWIDSRRTSLRWDTTRVWLEADLSRRELVLYRGSVAIRRIRVAVGRPGSPTPVGRFAVSDKLPGARLGGIFGCCVLALTGHQPRLPQGWPGGDRLAIHGGKSSSLGKAVSAGCMRAAEPDLRMLMQAVPLGTPVVVRT
jgi:L,D-transpeptidase-like protein